MNATSLHCASAHFDSGIMGIDKPTPQRFAKVRSDVFWDFGSNFVIGFPYGIVPQVEVTAFKLLCLKIPVDASQDELQTSLALHTSPQRRGNRLICLIEGSFTVCGGYHQKNRWSVAMRANAR